MYVERKNKIIKYNYSTAAADLFWASGMLADSGSSEHPVSPVYIYIYVHIHVRNNITCLYRYVWCIMCALRLYLLHTAFCTENIHRLQCSNDYLRRISIARGRWKLRTTAQTLLLRVCSPKPYTCRLLSYCSLFLYTRNVVYYIDTYLHE